MTSALRQQVAKGGVLEIESAGEWWEAIVTKVKDEKIKVHYVGGTVRPHPCLQASRCSSLTFAVAAGRRGRVDRAEQWSRAAAPDWSSWRQCSSSGTR